MHRKRPPFPFPKPPKPPGFGGGGGGIGGGFPKPPGMSGLPGLGGKSKTGGISTMNIIWIIIFLFFGLAFYKAYKS